MLACDDIMPSGWTPAAASSTLEDWTRTSSRGQQCSCFTITVRYSTEFGWDSRKFASGVRKYGKFSHFLTHLVVYGGQGQKQILSSLSTANVYRLSRRGLSTLSHRGGDSVVSGGGRVRGEDLHLSAILMSMISTMKYRQPLD